ncbi:MAG TPA: DUF58 domain-containing protein [Nitrososphaerales archaeon]|nr:DUF58 domain-containing protein [Nitrososphaerales archaeon]
MVFFRTSRANTVLLLAAIMITLGLVIAPQSEGVLLETGVGLFFFYYVLRQLLAAKVKALDSLEISRKYSTRTGEGKNLDVSLVFTNPTFLRLTLEVFDAYPKFFRLVSGTNSAVVDVPAKGYAELRYEIKPTSIGSHEFGPLRVMTRDIAGLFFYERYAQVPSEVEVTPSERDVARGALTASVVTAYGGSLTSKKRGEGLEFDDIREYSPGDPYKRIEWLSTARTGRLMVRQLRAETQLNVMVLLDSTETMSYGEAGQTKLDYSARSVASLLSYLGRRGDFIGLTVMKGKQHQVIPLGRGRAQVMKVLHLLGSLSPEAGDNSSLPQSVRRALTLGGIKGRTLFFVITDLDSEVDLSALKQLVAMRHEVVVISPYTPLFESHGLIGLDRAIYAINTSHQWRTRNILVRQASKLGISVLDVGPDDIFSRLVTQVEEMRRKGGS